MPSAYDVAGLLGLLAAGWYWTDSLRCKEIAREAGRRACQNVQAQFLDDSVVLVKLRVRRDVHGRMAFYRFYTFEFTREGGTRHPGGVTLHGQRVVRVWLEP